MSYAEKTGQAQMQSAPTYNLPTIQIQGSEGKGEHSVPAGNFKLVRMDIERARDEKVKIEDLETQKLEMVVLKIRRALAFYDKSNKRMIQTNEHNSPTDVVSLYGVDGGTKVGKASDLREEYQKLRTQQILYVYVPALKDKVEGGICKLIVKGSALGSEIKLEGVKKFYEYLSDYNKDKLHIHEHLTKLEAVQEEDYFSINFIRGAKLPEDKIKVVEEKIDTVHDKVVALDEYYRQRHEKTQKGDITQGEKENATEGQIEASDGYPTAESEGIDIDDIPFD